MSKINKRLRSNYIGLCVLALLPFQSAYAQNSNLESALTNLLRSAPNLLSGQRNGEPAPVAAPRTQTSAADGQDEYEANQAKLRANERARENRAPVPITPDMCIDAICVEQDLGEVAATLNWAPPEPMGPMSSSARRSYELDLKNCAQANQMRWSDKALKLCELLILGEWKPKAELVAFFKENRQPVCTTGGKLFKLEMKTPLGPTYGEVRFAKDGRPKFTKVFKEFFIKNADDVAEWRMLIRKKHPYLGNELSASTPWGGYVQYDYNDPRMRQNYQLTGRSVLFDANNEPNEGGCTPARKTISVQ